MSKLPESLTMTEAMAADLQKSYKHLHAHPELSMQENQTADYLAGRLEALGLEVFRCGGTGVVGVLRNGDGPVIGFRADTDGLPVLEDTGLEYASKDTGHLEDGTEVPVMHACGHDTHMATALKTAELYAQGTDDWAGTIVFILQPGEEVGAGAKAMVEDGLWQQAPQAGSHLRPTRDERAGRDRDHYGRYGDGHRRFLPCHRVRPRFTRFEPGAFY